MTLYKVTAEDGSACHGGRGTWPLPDGATPGAWWDLDEGRTQPRKLVACKYGLHLFEARQIVSWIGPALWEAEYEGEIIHDTDKVVVRKARLVRRIEAWNATTLYLWAADCAERQLVNFETVHRDDNRPRQALEAVRGYAAGTVSLDDLRVARAAAASAWAADAAESAARSAARSAQSAAQSAAWAADAAAFAARSAAAWAADAAASAAADAAARSASSAASERDWQTSRLLDLIGIKES